LAAQSEKELGPHKLISMFVLANKQSPWGRALFIFCSTWKQWSFVKLRIWR